jgi:hypothetical protein
VAQQEDRSVPVEVVFTLTDLGRNPVPKISATLCRSIDVGCQSPVGGPYVTDDDGKLRLPLYLGFRGYLDIPPSDAHPELLPTIIYLPVPNEARAKDPRFHASLGSTLQLNVVTGQAGKPADPARGHLVFAIDDCQSNAAANVDVYAATNTDQKTFTFYLDANGSPSITQQKTSASGTGGIFNLVPGSVTLNYDYEGRRIGSQNIVVRQGTLSYVVADPTE